MGCAVSFTKSAAGDDGDDIWVSVCRERKRLMKSAVDRRYALAGAHSKYNQSLYAVALALRLFVARHSSSASAKFLITFPKPSPPPPPVGLHRTKSEPPPAVTNSNAGEEEAEDDESTGDVCKHFHDDVTVDPTPPVVNQQDPNDGYVGWDFFSPYDNSMVHGGGGGGGGEKLGAAEEGGGERKGAVADAKVSLEANDSEAAHDDDDDDDGDGDDDGMELLDALKDLEGDFLKAYESGVEFSKLLEFTNVGPLHHLDSKESSEKFIPSIAWHKSTITRSPSCRSLLSSSSRSSSTWTPINTNSDLFDDTGGMESGSHLSTLGRLFAWEKKLYDEVKAGNEMKKVYDRKSSQLGTENGSNKRGVEEQVNDLYSQILVSMKICNSISKRIEKVRDDELQPQLVELLHGLVKTWKVMLESHRTQSRTMFKVKTFVNLTNDRSCHLATLQLEAEIQNWCSCFSTYISSMEAYIESLTEWAYRTLNPDHELTDPPLVFAVCRDWLTVMKNLPDKAVTYSMKRLSKDLRNLWAQQRAEQQQKRKVDRLVAESVKRVVGFEKEQRSVVGFKPTLNVKNKVDFLAEKKAQLDEFREMVEFEKAKHKECVEETRRVILVGFQTGFSSVFDSLTEFSEVCVWKYEEVAKNATSRPNLIHGC